MLVFINVVGKKNAEDFKFEDKSGGLRPKIEPNLEYFPTWSKVVWGSDADLGIFSTILYGDICRGYFFSVGIGR